MDWCSKTCCGGEAKDSNEINASDIYQPLFDKNYGNNSNINRNNVLLKDNISSVLGENNKEDIENLTKKIEDLTKKIEDLTKKIEKKSEQLTILEKEKRGLLLNKIEIMDDVSKAEEQLTRLHGEIGNKEEQNNRLLNEISRLEDKHQSLLKNTKDAEEKISKYNATIKNLNKKIEGRKNRAENLQEQANNLEKAVNLLRGNKRDIIGNKLLQKALGRAFKAVLKKEYDEYEEEKEEKQNNSAILFGTARKSVNKQNT